MNNNGMFYTNVDDYETKEDMMNDFIALRMYDMTKDKEIDRLNNIINELEKTFKRDLESILDFEEKHPEACISRFPEYYLEQLQELKEGNK